MPIVTYLFLGGAGAGALLVLIVLDLLSPRASMVEAQDNNYRHYSNYRPKDVYPPQSSYLPQSNYRRQSNRDRQNSYLPQSAYRPFFLPGFVACCTALILGALCLLLDLGRPDRMLNLFLNPTFSYLTFGTYSLSIALVCAGFLAVIWSGLGPKASLPRWLVRSLEIIGIASAVAVMLYTGLLLYSIGAGTFLDSPLIPVLFVLSALSCGLALIFAASHIAGSAAMFSATLRRLARLDSVVLLLELLALAALIVVSLLGGQTASIDAVQVLLWGPVGTIFWLLLVAGGILLPLVLENIRILPLHRSALAIAFAVLMGGFVLRWSLVEVGLPTVILGA